MCGIAGIMDLDGGPVGVRRLQRMTEVIRHRGPDDAGYHVEPGVGLGMRRLSIIDLQTGHQPIHNEDRSVWVVLNGEIYNFQELRHDLEAKGHTFTTGTDTEVIVHLYEEAGLDCVEHLRGMFAFAVWDSKRQRLLLARDRLGIKPLYYGLIGRRLVFGSELKSILQLPEVERRIDWRALDHLLTFMVTPRSSSIIEDVRKLEPAHLLVASRRDGIRSRRYWDVRFQPDHAASEAEHIERFRATLEESVRLHMVSDVPVGAFLSGGIDSSAVVATMSRLSSRPVKTYSIGFPERDYDELDDARLVARTLGTDHHDQVLDLDVTDILDDLAWHLDEPFGDSSAIPTYMVSQLAARDVTVVLSGDGGDEIFAGYDRYAVERGERRWPLPGPARHLLGAVASRMPDGARGRNWLHHKSLNGDHRYLDANTLFRRQARRRLLRPEVRAALGDSDPVEAAVRRLAGDDAHWLSRLQRFDLEGYLPLDILTKVDRASMAHSLEARVPLLDHRLVELAATAPPDLLLRGRRRKHLFKEAMRGILPDRIIDKPKQGFAIPLGRWFRGGLEPMVRELLLSERSRQRGIFEPRALEQLLQQHHAGRDLDLQLWTLMSFELWCRTFLDRQPVRRPRRNAPASAEVSLRLGVLRDPGPSL